MSLIRIWIMQNQLMSMKWKSKNFFNKAYYSANGGDSRWTGHVLRLSQQSWHQKNSTTQSIFVFSYVLRRHHARHSSSLAAWAANSRCRRLVLCRLCLGSSHQHRGTYASIFFHLDGALLTPSVWDDAAAAFISLCACLGLMADSQGCRVLVDNISR